MAQMDPVASQHSKSPLVDTRMMALALPLACFLWDTEMSEAGICVGEESGWGP